MRKFLSLSTVLALPAALTLGACLAAHAAELPKRVTFATLQAGSNNNSMANALAKVASDYSGILVVTRPGSSASSWMSTLNSRGTPELGHAHILDVWWGYTGKLSPTPLPGDPYGAIPFYEPSPNLRMLITGPDQKVGMIVKDSRPWQSLTDAKGQTLGGGFSAHAGAYSSLVAALMAENLSETKDFKLVPVPGVAPSIAALSEGRVEVATASVGMAQVAEANSKEPVRFLDVPHDPASVARVKQAFPGSRVELYTGRGPGIAKDTWLIFYPLITTASTHLSDDAAYALVKSWYEHYQDAAKMHAAFVDWGPSKFVNKNATIPYHNGAIRFYREVGLWSKEMDEIQAALLRGEYPFLK